MEEVRTKIYKFTERALEQFGSEDVTTLTPERTDNYLTFFSGYSALLEEEMGELELQGADYMAKLINEDISNASAEKLWNATEAGRRMIILKRKLKAVDKIRSACRDRLRRFNDQSYNRY